MRNAFQVKQPASVAALATILLAGTVWGQTTGTAPTAPAQPAATQTATQAAGSAQQQPSTPAAQPGQQPAATQQPGAPQQPTAKPAAAPSTGGEDTQGPVTGAEATTSAPIPPADPASGAGPQGVIPKGPQPGANGVIPGVKPGSVEDVNAVGTRDIGGRGMGNWYSTESEIKQGKAYSMELEKSIKFITDPVVTEYVNRVGQNIVKNSDAKVPFTIKVIDSDEINAMALPGGFFYVNSGLILAADDEAEMAGVMAHEIAHVAAHHAMREQTRMNYAQLSTIPLIMVTGYSMVGYGIYEAANIGIPLAFLQFSRDFEKQADFLGVQYMYRAGYDPEGLVTMFEKVKNLQKTKPGMVAKAFDTHPQTPDRIENIQKEIAQLLPAKQEYLVTTSEFQDVKARLARIENKRKLRDGSNEKKPSLRRASTNPQDNGTAAPGTTSTDDTRPTLHRRDN